MHPYDDEAIIAGQGTVGIEMLEAVPELDTLVVAVGGGGLIAGIAVAAKALKPGIEVIGVQTLRFPNMFNAVKHAVAAAGRQHHRRRHRGGHAGRLTQAIIEKHVDDMVLVDEGDIEQAIVMLLEIEKTLVEGAGAAAAGRAAEGPGSGSAAARSGWCWAAATSTRCCWRRSSSAAWCGPAGWRASG